MKTPLNILMQNENTDFDAIVSRFGASDALQNSENPPERSAENGTRSTVTLDDIIL